MQLHELLCDAALTIPRPATPIYRIALQSDAIEFADKLTRVSDPRFDSSALKQAATTATAIAESVNEAICFCLEARPGKAMTSLSTAMTHAEPRIKKLITKPVSSEAIGSLYRVRTNCPSDPGASGMFHIPFELRHIVPRQRFSYPGLPCLYLGQSLYCCWHEMGQPDLNDMWISRLEVAEGKRIQLLDLGWRPHWVAGMLQSKHSQEASDFGLAYATLWPLIAACTFKRHCPATSPFAVEYLIPQLLTEWLLSREESGFRGIRYPSTHIEDEAIGLAGMSVVIPSRTQPSRGPCKSLGTEWKLTKPVRWQTIFTYLESERSTRFAEEMVTIAGREIPYRQTQFCAAEGFLEKCEPQAIQIPNTSDGVFE